MPDITVRGTFKPDPSYNHVEEVERSIQMMRKYLDNQPKNTGSYCSDMYVFIDRLFGTGVGRISNR